MLPITVQFFSRFGVRRGILDFIEQSDKSADALFKNIKRGSARKPANVAGKKFLIFDLTIQKERSPRVITKSKILAQSDYPLLKSQVRF